MSIKDWPGGVVSKDQVVPSGPYLNSTASGIWTMDQVANYTKQGIWPTAGNAEPDVASVFSTYLYDGTNVAQTITNGIDLAGKGGLVWQKLRAHPTPPDGQDHYLRDTERGVGKRLISNSTAGETNDGGITSVNSDGFALSSGTAGNLNGATYASWTFRKAPKFFDVVSGLTSDGSGNLPQFNHNLGSTPGCVIMKATDSGSNWVVFHKGLSASGANQYIQLNNTNAATNATGFGIATDTTFEVGAGSALVPSVTYVAYLFAHETDAKSMIQCGSYTGNGSATGPVINLGWQPQWLMIKNASDARNWIIVDVMRGFSAGPQANTLFPNATNAEDPAGTRVKPTSTGFEIITSSFDYNKSGDDFIYMAIRVPMMIAPTAGTEVFAMDMDGGTNNHYTSGFPVDLGVYKSKLNTYNWSFNDRLRGAFSLKSNTNAAENGNTLAVFDNNTGWADSAALTSEYPSWMWKRAKSYFDVLAYTGNSSNRNLSHNLAVAPEMVWFKSRSSTVDWIVYHKDLGGTYPSSRNYLYLNQSGGVVAVYQPFTAAPTASTMALSASSGTNSSGVNYIAYLFATLAGVSKVGSVTHSGTTNVDCGFSAGARFVLLKRTDATGDWYIWDSARGISAGNDPYLQLNSTAAEVTNTDYIDPLSSGFTITSTFTAGDYIFYAIA